MICKTYAAACIGLQVVPVTIETDISAGVGLYNFFNIIFKMF